MKIWNFLRMLIHGKFINVVRPENARITPTPSVKKDKAPEKKKVTTDEFARIERELKETKNMLGKMMHILLSQQNKPVQVVYEKEVAEQQNGKDIFGDVMVNDTGKDLEAKINAKEEQITERDLQSDIDKLMNISNGKS